MKQEEKPKEMYNETERLNKRIERLKQGIHVKGREGNKIVYEEGQKQSEYNIQKIEEFSKERVGSKRALQRFETLEQFGYKINKDFRELTEQEIKTYQNEIEHSKLAFNTVEVRKIIIKQFLNWLGLEKIAELITPRRAKSNDRLPEELLTNEDVKKLLQTCRKNRDKCLVSVLYESGCRISELRGIKIKHLEFDNSGTVKLFLIGKTGKRRIMLRDSVPYIKTLLNEHPQAEDKEAYLFLSNKDSRVDYNTINGFLKILFRRARIQKPSNPHIFRHSRATYLANYLTEQQLKVYLGWCKNSQMASVYVHLSGSNIDNALLSKVYNVKEVKQEAQENKLQPKECPKCRELNSATTQFCKICSCPLDFDKQEEVEKWKEAIGSVISELMSKQQSITEDNTKAIMREQIAKNLIQIPQLIKK